MKIIVSGSLGHISKPLTQQLIAKGHTVTVISSKADRKTEIESLGASAAIGSVFDQGFLTKTFTGADVVYTMIPPGNFADPDFDVYETVDTMMRSYKQGIEASGVKHVVHLSSIGAHTDKGNGLLKLHHLAETILKELPANVHLTFMRPTGFYYNLLAYIPMIKSQCIIAANYGGDNANAWVAPADIADAIVEEIEHPSAVSQQVRYVASEELSSNEVARILGEAIGKPDLQWIQITNEQMLNGLVANGMRQDIAEGMVEMYSARDVVYEDYNRHRPVLGKTKLTEFAKQFAAVYNQQ